LLARTEKYFVKRYEEETNLRCHILIDASSSMYFPQGVDPNGPDFNKIKFSVYATAALIELLKRQRDAVGLTVFADGIRVNTRASASESHHNYLYSELEKLLDTVDVSEKQTTLVTDTLHEIAESIHQRSMVIIFSDMLDNSAKSDELFTALQHLRHRKHDVILFHVVDHKKEVDFDFENRPYTFTDMESGEQIKVNPADIRETYVKRMADFTRDLKLKCGQYQVDFVEADIHSGFNPVLMEYLLRRQKIY
jgi:uncharacterized protein (DUF58 family)